MKTVLITGASRGVGRETAGELTKRGYRVYLGTRDLKANGEPVEDMSAEAFWIRMDVSDSQSIRRAAKWLAGRESILDVLINNAGIYPDGGHSILNISRDQLGETFQTNTFGPIEVTQAFLPILRKSTAARVINVSSGYGQLDGLSAQVPSYSLSKLALNGFTRMMADTLKANGIAVNSIDPGWVRTRMGGSSATRSVSEGAAGIVWLASQAPHEWTGRFFRDGQPIEW